MEERKFSEQELVRREKMQELIDKGIDPFGQRFDVTAYSKGIKEQYGDKTHEELEEVRNNPNAYMTKEIMDRCEIYVDLPKDVKRLYDDAWVNIKSNN